jgi:hypothetical protein
VLSEAEVYRRWLVFAALLPYAVHHDHRAEREAFERQHSRQRAERLLAIPLQRAPSEPRRAPSGSPARPNTAWGTRSTRR